MQPEKTKHNRTLQAAMFYLSDRHLKISCQPCPVKGSFAPQGKQWMVFARGFCTTTR